jgi:RimJ/RimL family protein N-acetyltransferase
MTRASLKTARLTLRPVGPDDQADILAAMSLDVARWLSVVPYPYGAADFQHFWTQVAVPGKTFVIEDATGFAGVMGIEGSFGYWLALRAQGLGYATEAARAVLSSRFLDDPSPVVTYYFAENDRSANVLRKLGFRQTGQGMKHCKALGAARAHVNVALSFADFIAHLPVLQSKRLTYRAMLSHDAPVLHGLVSQWQVTRQLGSFPWPADPEYSEMRAQPYQGAGFVWGIFREGQFIGWVAITDGTLGYMIAPNHHRQGYAREAVIFAMEYANLPHIEAEVWDDNFASLALLIKCGFVVDHPTSAFSKARGKVTGGLRLSWRPA